MTATHPAWLWFPSEWISWHAVTLPKTRQWRTALPFLIEEKLASSIDSVKIIPTPVTQDGERYAVAVDEHQWQQWEEQQAALGFAHKAWCPDVLALPWSMEMGVVVLIEGDRMRMRWGQWQGAAGSVETMMVLLSQLMASSSLPITLYADTLPTQWSDAWQTQHYARASFVPEVPRFDLREGAGSAWWSWKVFAEWRIPLVLFGLLCGVWMLQHTWLAWQANAHAQQMQVSTQSLFKQQFPHIKRQVNVLAQARGDLKQRLQAQVVHKTSVQAVIAMVQNQMRGWPNVQQLEWQSGQLTLSWSENVSVFQRDQLRAEAGWQLRWLNDRQVQIGKVEAP